MPLNASTEPAATSLEPIKRMFMSNIAIRTSSVVGFFAAILDYFLCINPK
jgi:hypothetical protein